MELSHGRAVQRVSFVVAVVDTKATEGYYGLELWSDVVLVATAKARIVRCCEDYVVTVGKETGQKRMDHRRKVRKWCGEQSQSLVCGERCGGGSTRTGTLCVREEEMALVDGFLVL
jgi:hypothetical protein